MAFLVLVRHGQSEWNAKGLWTGLTDVSLNEKGKEEAEIAGKELKDITFDLAFTSALKRAKETYAIIKRVLNLDEIPVFEDAALNEKNYGIFTGKNKWEVKKELGEEEFLKIRRSWDYPIENGESLKDVYDRVVPYYQTKILPQLKMSKNVLVCASGNSIRALVKYLDHITDTDISSLEIATGEIYLYQIDSDGKVIAKEKRLNRPNLV